MVKTGVGMISEVLPNDFGDHTLGMNKLDSALRHLIRLPVKGDFDAFFKNRGRIEVLGVWQFRLVRQALLPEVIKFLGCSLQLVLSCVEVSKVGRCHLVEACGIYNILCRK